MKTILLVDDEKLFLSSLSEGLTKLFPQVNIVTAQNGLEAIKVLDTQDVILIITDLQMPIMSGFELLDCLIHDYPDVSIVVMTAYGNPQIEDNLSGCGSIVYLEKPIDFQALAEHIQAIIAPTAKGHIKGIDLPNILQLLYLEHKTCTLTVYSKSRIGHLYFIDGELIDAEFDLFKAENAAYEILKWIKPDIEIESTSSRSAKIIKLPLDHILLEAAKKQDEYRKETGSFRRINFDTIANDTENPLLERNIIKDKNKTNLNLLSNDNDILELEPELHTPAISLSNSPDNLLKAGGSTPSTDLNSPLELLAEETEITLQSKDSRNTASFEEQEQVLDTKDQINNTDTLNLTLDDRKEISMANNINQILTELMAIDGSMAMAIVDSKSGMALGTTGGGLNLEIAAAGNSEVIRSKTKVMTNLGLKDKVEDILITLGQQYHLLRPLGVDPNIFIYVVLNRAQSNLALARYKLADCEKRLIL